MKDSSEFVVGGARARTKLGLPPLPPLSEYEAWFKQAAEANTNLKSNGQKNFLSPRFLRRIAQLRRAGDSLGEIARTNNVGYAKVRFALERLPDRLK